MEGQDQTMPKAHRFAAISTNILAGLWAVAAAYTLFDSLLITHRGRYAMAAIFPLIAAWGTLERKRWGRLALLGVSLTTMLAFACMSGLFARLQHFWQPGALIPVKGVPSLMVAYGLGAAAAISLLTLAVITGFWLCLPEVAAAFNQNKRAALVKAQRGIAILVVAGWAVFIGFAPLASQIGQEDAPNTPLRARPRTILTRPVGHRDSSLPTRSAASISRR